MTERIFFPHNQGEGLLTTHMHEAEDLVDTISVHIGDQILKAGQYTNLNGFFKTIAQYIGRDVTGKMLFYIRKHDHRFEFHILNKDKTTSFWIRVSITHKAVFEFLNNKWELTGITTIK